MMRAMRENAKWIFYILAIAFVGWLVFDVGMGITGRQQTASGDVVLKVNGTEIHTAQYQAALQNAYEQYRHQSGGSLTREDEQQIQNQVVDQITQQLLLEQQYRRMGITASDQEVIQAAQSSPPPEAFQSPEFQTNGQFDITKWQRYLATATDPQFLASLEERYRQQIPQMKLAQFLTADIYIPDSKLWRIYRDQHESVTVAVLPVRPAQIADQDAPVSDAEIQQYYDAHKADFKRPAIAYTSFIAQPRLPDQGDSSAALARITQLHDEIMHGKKFEDVAKTESADSGTASKGGDLGWMTRSEQGLDPRFVAALKQLRPGELSKPVLSSFGYHLIWIASAKGDSVHVRHILVPIEPQGKHLDYVESRADSLDKLVAERQDGSLLDSVSRRFNLPLAHAPPLFEGDRMTLGTYVIPDVSVWAFEARVGETSPVIEGRAAYYVFRLDSLTPGGTPPLPKVRQQVVDVVRMNKKRDLAKRRAEDLARDLPAGVPLMKAGTERGLAVTTVGPFTRLTPPPVLQGSPVAIGAAFGLKPGTRSGVVTGTTGYFLIEPLSHSAADSAAWVKQKDEQRESLLQPARQGRIQAYVAALRDRAKIVDRRKELYAAQPASSD
ncbi:MAG TPA: peptidyl-prolyl cis-trans isomerase [Gemmatimonadales bacterium]|nr:peptidyl-prolyl cis-trans isomerase [Gemmatimonadales bacterium]